MPRAPDKRRRIPAPDAPKVRCVLCGDCWPIRCRQDLGCQFCPRCEDAERNRTDAEPPTEPTDAPAGSPEKIAVMEARFLARRRVFHPGDSGAVVFVPAKRGGRPVGFGGNGPRPERHVPKGGPRQWDEFDEEEAHALLSETVADLVAKFRAGGRSAIITGLCSAPTASEGIER